MLILINRDIRSIGLSRRISGSCDDRALFSHSVESFDDESRKYQWILLSFISTEEVRLTCTISRLTTTLYLCSQMNEKYSFSAVWVCNKW